ncbi:hypothetical protein QBC41DRAFT_237574 [Cercophora samala]|uniref:Uncharacterized protein n=1 Tax=Cercophora samala TaxID=330535 RepID=A0AA39YWY5_9PEZI|nr:hypothetical protein QBC41DRAFT_237574 [Cercophora samala]
MLYRQFFLSALVVLLCTSHGVCSIGYANATSHAENSAHLAEIYRPFLTNLPQHAASFNPLLGGLDADMCCQLAVNESLVIVNGSLMIRPGQTFYRGDMATLERFPSFPCHSKFNGSQIGPPMDFWTPYTWCRDRCPGWSVTKPDSFGNWLKPLSSWILPSLIFCLSIPRRRRIHIPKRLFAKPKNIFGTLFYLVKIPAAALIVTVDTLIWLSVVFSVAGPILVSATYEALLDFRILRFLQTCFDANRISVRSRAHLLLVVLLGNLDLKRAWDHSKLLVRDLPDTPLLPRPTLPHNVPSIMTTPPATSPAPCATCSSNDTLSAGSSPSPDPLPSIQAKLRAMLDGQDSFGHTCGAAVLFYIASFIWSTYDIKESYGSYQSAHQLAFGLLWMTIPHIALLTSVLLASSNPSVWQGISPPSPTPLAKPSMGSLSPTLSPRSGLNRLKSFLPGVTGPVAFVLSPGGGAAAAVGGLKATQYKPSWVWNRGSNKLLWLFQFSSEYPACAESIYKDVLACHGILLSCVNAVVLIFIPAFFAGLVSFNTPQVGLGCRSLTMVVYGLAQVLLVGLWGVRMAGELRYRRGEMRATEGKRGVELGEYGRQKGFWGWSWTVLFGVGVFFGAVASVGGTVFLMIGLYSNCLCWIPAVYWFQATAHPKAAVFWNSATQDQIDNSMKWWFPAGIVGTVFMVVIAYSGWWYQRQLRTWFCTLIHRIGMVDERDFRERTLVC